MTQRRDFISILCILILTLSLYSNTLKNGFVYDDYEVIIENLLIKDIQNLPKLFENKYLELSGEISYRPVATFTYFIDYKLFGLNPWGYHLTNIILHALNGVSLYIFLTLINSSLALNPKPLTFGRQNLIRCLYLNPPLLISLFFVTNPVLTEAINAVSFREDLLAFLFYISAFNLYLLLRASYIYICQSVSSFLLYLLSCILYFISLLSKEMAATLPLVILCYGWFSTDKKKKSLYSILFDPYNMGYAVVTLVYIYIRFYYFYNIEEGFLRPWGLMERLQTMPWLLLHYFRLAMFPVSLSTDYIILPVRSFLNSGFIVPSIIGIILLTALVAAKRGISFGVLFFMVTLIPVYNIIPLGQPFAERYLYLPTIGLAIVLGSVFSFLLETSKSKSNKYMVLILLLATLSIYSLAVIKRNQVWKDSYSLWLDTVRKMPNSSLAHSELGLAYLEQGRLYEAIKQIQNAIELNPKDPVFHYNLGGIYIKQGRFNEAISVYQTALRLKPDYFAARLSLAVAMGQSADEKVEHP